MSNIDFDNALLDSAWLDGVDLSGATFAGASLVDAHLEGSSLIDTDFSNAIADGMDVRGAAVGRTRVDVPWWNSVRNLGTTYGDAFDDGDPFYAYILAKRAAVDSAMMLPHMRMPELPPLP